MPAEVIQTIKGKGNDPEPLGLGKSIELDTPAGKILVFGTQDGFAVRRQTEPGNAGAPDILYDKENSLKIIHISGDITIISALPKPTEHPLGEYDGEK